MVLHRRVDAGLDRRRDLVAHPVRMCAGGRGELVEPVTVSSGDHDLASLRSQERRESRSDAARRAENDENAVV